MAASHIVSGEPRLLKSEGGLGDGPSLKRRPGAQPMVQMNAHILRFLPDK